MYTNVYVILLNVIKCNFIGTKGIICSVENWTINQQLKYRNNIKYNKKI